jgi:predicted phosphodiesterase
MADTHLFSSEIGGNWSDESLTIFKEKILPKVKDEKPDIVIFLGDILDPHSGKSDPRWSKGDEASRKFVEVIKKSGLKNIYLLKGNHDYLEPLKNISMMAGPQLRDNEWLTVNGTSFYFFTSRYPDIKKAEEDILSIPDINSKNKIILMHENVSIYGAQNVSRETIKKLSNKYDFIFNGHQHDYNRLYNNVYCLSSTLPWRPGYGNCDVEISWSKDKPEIKENENRFGYYIVEVEKKKIEFKPVEIGLKIVTATLFFSKDTANDVRQRLIELSKKISEEMNPQEVIIRVHLNGALKEGEERIDVGFTDIENKYFSNFYEGKSKNILRVENLRGGGAYLSKDDLRYVSVEDALKELEGEIPEIRDFYKEVGDLIEKKTFDGDALLERIKNSKVLNRIMEEKK